MTPKDEGMAKGIRPDPKGKNIKHEKWDVSLLTTNKEVVVMQLKKRAIWGLLIWGVVLIAAYVIFFLEGGPQTFLDNDTRVDLTRAVFTVGFISYFFMLILTRIKSDRKKLMKDERDELISKRAYSEGFFH